MVLEITSESQFHNEINSGGLVVVDFFTTWCGPCKAMAPHVEELSRRHKDVKFLKVDTDKNPFAGALGIRSIPTFHFYVKGAKVDEMLGANPSQLEQKVLQHRVANSSTSSFGGSGVTLGSSAPAWNGVGVPPGDNARAARLRAFGAIDQKSSDTLPAEKKQDSKKDAPVDADAIDEDEALARALELSQAEITPTTPTTTTSAAAAAAAQDALDDAEAAAAVQEEMSAGGSDEWGDDMVPVPVDETLLGELVDMGFVEVRARKAIVHGKNIEGALAWLDEHQDDPDIDQPYMVRKGDIRKPLTKEELTQRTAEVKEKIVKMRQMKERETKALQLQQEKERRERGQKMGETQEERDRLMRRREADKIKREKEAEKKERERLRAEIARDKELRRANKGVLPSVLGVDGYNPSIVNYNETASDSPATHGGSTDKKVAPTASKSAATTASSSTDARSPEVQIDTYIETISRYRTGGDGGNALKLLITFVKNIVDNPEDPKYKSINPESAAFKSKLTPLVGPVQILKALGFVKAEDDGKLKIESFDAGLFQSTLLKLTKAEKTFKLMNP